VAAVSRRLSSLDASFLALEQPGTPMHIAALMLVRAEQDVPPAAAVDRLVAVVRRRLGQVPQLRCRLRMPWAPWAAPEWVEDPRFDPAAHVSGSVIDVPAGRCMLAAEAARHLARPLDRARPLWEIRIIGGLRGGELALLAKLHHALADGMHALILAAALFDELDHEPAAQPSPCDPREDRSGLFAGTRALLGTLRRGVLTEPATTARWLADHAHDVANGAARLHTTASIAASVTRAATWPSPPAPFNTALVPTRRLGMLTLPLDEIHQVGKTHGGTVNDVLLAVTAGALRAWLAEQGHPRYPIRALVPVSQYPTDTHADGASVGNALSGYLLTLPVDVPDPLTRLRLIHDAMGANKAAGPARGAGALPLLAEALPAALVRFGLPLAAPLTGHLATRLFNLVITNLAFPDLTLHIDRMRLGEIYPFVPLGPGQGLGLAIGTYQGTAHIGIQTDDGTGPDPDTLAAYFRAALDEYGP
jgi:diacylglycerol O-acyltransferase